MSNTIEFSALVLCSDMIERYICSPSRMGLIKALKEMGIKAATINAVRSDGDIKKLFQWRNK